MNTMRAVDGNGAAAGAVAGGGQFPAGGAQEGILISAVHFGNDGHAHDADDHDHHQHLNQGEGAGSHCGLRIADCGFHGMLNWECGMSFFHKSQFSIHNSLPSYQFPISAPSAPLALSGSMAHKSGPVV
jgi:hypothetical protein